MRESITIEQARAALTYIHGVASPSGYQIAMFILYGIVEPSEEMA